MTYSASRKVIRDVTCTARGRLGADVGALNEGSLRVRELPAGLLASHDIGVVVVAGDAV